MKKVLAVIFISALFLLTRMAAGQSLNDQLINAARRGDTAAVQQLLQQGANIEAKDNDSSTVLITAGQGGHSDIVDLLIKKGANIEAKDKWGDTPLINAALWGNTEVVKLLLNSGANIEARNVDGWTALICAAGQGQVEVIRILLDRRANIEAQGKKYGYTALNNAAREGKTDAVKLLLERGANIETKGSFAYTPLITAISEGNTATVQMLLQHGANIEAKNEVDGGTPLLMAVSPNTDIMKLLLAKGANIEAQDDHNGCTALYKASYSGLTAAVQLLIDRNATINSRCRSTGETPLMGAAEYGMTDIVRLLIEKGANIEMKDNDGNTALIMAVKEGKKDVVSLLIEKGADRNNSDRFGRTAEAVAINGGETDIVALLRGTGGSAPRQDFDVYIQKTINAGYISHNDLKEIVRLVHLLSPPPEVPQGAQDEMTAGKAAFKLARRSEDFKDAEDHFNKTTMLAPWLPGAYFNLAVAQEKQLEWDKAKYSFESYLIAAPEATDAQDVKQRLAELDIEKRRCLDYEQEVYIGESLSREGATEYVQAIEHWNRALDLCPDHPNLDNVYYDLGETYMNQGNLDDAFKYMQQALDLNPNSEVSSRYTNMGFVLEKRGDRDKACTYYSKACSLGSQVGCSNHSRICQ